MIEEGGIQIFVACSLGEKTKFKFCFTCALGEGKVLNLGLLIDLEKVEIQNFNCRSDGNNGGYGFLHYTCIIGRKGVECWVSIGLRWQHLPIHQA